MVYLLSMVCLLLVSKRRGHRGLSKVVDVTIAYPEGRPINLVSIATGWDPPCATHVHYR